MWKIFKKDFFLIFVDKSIYIYIFICILSVISVTGIYRNKKNQVTDNNQNWAFDIKKELKELESQMEEASEENAEYEEEIIAIEKDIEIDNYRLANDISDSDWRKPLLDYYLFQTAPDTRQQNCINDAINKNDWKLYYQYLRTLNQEMLNRGDATDRELMDASIELTIINLYFKFNIQPESESDVYVDWRNAEVHKYYWAINSLGLSELYLGQEEYYLSASQKEKIKRDAEISLYRIENNIQSNDNNDSACLLKLLLNMKYVVYILSILFFLKIFTNTIESKTIRIDLMMPLSRKEILFNKQILFLFVTSLLMSICYLLGVIISAQLYGINANAQILYVFGHYISINYYAYIWILWATSFIELYFVEVLIRWLGIYGANNSISIVLSMIFFFAKFGIKIIAEQYHMFFLKYIPFVWYDWIQFVDRNVYVSGTSPLFCIIGTCVLNILLLVDSYGAFVKKDF